jgi:hypothetical protein
VSKHLGQSSPNLKQIYITAHSRLKSRQTMTHDWHIAVILFDTSILLSTQFLPSFQASLPFTLLCSPISYSSIEYILCNHITSPRLTMPTLYVTILHRWGAPHRPIFGSIKINIRTLVYPSTHHQREGGSFIDPGPGGDLWESLSGDWGGH